jgi:large subunit ribosomal protein L24
MKMKLRKGDRVQVIAGKDLGKDGVVMRVLPQANRVIVEGVNVAKKHQRPVRATMQAGIIDKDMPLHVSNVALICNTCGPTRIGYRFDDAGRKIRICRKCRGDV